jgi:hypothetical protein
MVAAGTAALAKIQRIFHRETIHLQEFQMTGSNLTREVIQMQPGQREICQKINLTRDASRQLV